MIQRAKYLSIRVDPVGLLDEADICGVDLRAIFVLEFDLHLGQKFWRKREMQDLILRCYARITSYHLRKIQVRRTLELPFLC